ncbi:uncharacterized protein ACLA_025080 [Aspergillus clavatus NRRL 1]|uniref:Uncharacterized protein n=1 Tax=Aspergillus clavatus (strain ATCC 1007 / CBS 513.65 / DSM 816 / NCTC 3887 / NRRL 1 / QM 1276 / 107) TaxID=344612 RepID=A1CQ70_ASPCL|nr:uncharacterized protein ACLA_025080 [Aspergillus clavatus NRRL 1]EAW07791.1 conserved hypothetical protein [Aspergillus clavatus NRRL 1]
MLDSTASGRNARQHPQPAPIIPPSPTLSNPDMILPFDEGERESSTPSPPFNLPSLSHLQGFYERKPLPSLPGANNPAPGQLLPPSNWSQKKNFARHAWASDTRDVSRRLSDIGEEDASSSSPPRKGGYSGSLTVTSRGPGPKLASSPVLYGRGEKEARENGAWSSSSGSTISGASESSLREEASNRADPAKDEIVQLGVESAVEQKGPDDALSSAILSSEAERILENAKKKLTLMEGNLSRARTTMRSSPSLSSTPSPVLASHPMGLGQPVGGLYQSISRADRRASALRPRTTYTSSQDAINNRHSRVYSETNLPSSAPSDPSSDQKTMSRSLSAMGSSTSSNLHNDDRSFRYEPTRAYLTHRASVSSMQPPASLQARRPNVTSEENTAETTQGLGITSDDANANKISSMEEFNSAYPSQDPPSRAQSQLQVRDLQDQMKGLHIKISSLKVKAQEDNLRRRSLQSLRTPSPFTEGDQWYPSALELKNSNGSLKSDAERGRMAENPPRTQHHGPETSTNGPAPGRRDYGGRDSAASFSRRPSAAPHAVEPTDQDDRQSVIESLYEDAEEGDYDTDGSSSSDIDREALEEILREPFDDDDLEDSLEAFPAVPHHTEMTPHEEREDAFDYEHFILHSALGNFSQSKLRRTSNVSTSSVETTRPAHGGPGARHLRSDSTASLSTIATFATASEGDDLESVLYWDRKFNDELRSRQNFRDPEPSRHDSEVMGTPRASRSQFSRSDHRNGNSNTSSRTISPVRRSDSATTGTVTPSSLVSSLVSTVRAASSSPYPNPNAPETNIPGFNNDDTRLLEQLFRSLGQVCLDLQTLTASTEPDPKTLRVLRRRLDAARRVLDGELDA